MNWVREVRQVNVANPTNLPNPAMSVAHARA
jgi:hypothetical protein